MTRLEDVLGIENYLSDADRLWGRWCQVEPLLAAAPSRAALREWLATDPPNARATLSALASLAAEDGANEPAAAAVLAWVMIPAAAALARRYRASVPDVEEWIAAQLWIEVRSVPWRRVNNPAASIKFALAHALRGEVDGVEVPVDPGEQLALVRERAGDQSVQPQLDSDLLLALVLQRAVDGGVITAGDRQILVDLVAHAHTHPAARRRNGGLTSVAALTHVSTRHAVPVRTVSRHAKAAITAINAAHQRQLLDVAI